MLAAIALGSNLGDREENLQSAIRRIEELGSIQAISSFHDTEPVGYLDQPRFLNGALLLETELPPVDLLQTLLKIELEMGRRRDLVAAKGPRVIDLDLLLMDDLILTTPELILPHPAMAERLFVLEPLAEIAADWVHPVSGFTIAQLRSKLSSSAEHREAQVRQ